MKVDIRYRSYVGEREIAVDFGEGVDLEVISPSDTGAALSDGEIIDALGLPFDPGPGTLYIVNDLDRPTPTERLLALLARRYPGALSGDVIFATGAHKISGSTEDIGRRLLGRLYDSFAGRIYCHDSTADPTVPVGTTPRGTIVDVSSRLFGYDNIVAIGSVEPHWFAGYTGGRKSIVPGIASFETIRQNHSLALSPGIGPAVTTGNPVYEDLQDAATLILEEMGGNAGDAVVVGVNVVSRGDGVYAIFCGPILDSIAPLFDRVGEIYIKKEKPADIVIAIAEAPMDRDLYQAMKSFENVRSVIKGGGSYILVALSPDGVGPPHFSETMELASEKNSIVEHLSGEYRLGDHKFKNPLDFINGGGTITVVSELLYRMSGRISSGREVGFARVCETLEGALEIEMERHRDIDGDVRVLVVKDAVNLVVMAK